MLDSALEASGESGRNYLHTVSILIMLDSALEEGLPSILANVWQTVSILIMLDSALEAFQLDFETC